MATSPEMLPVVNPYDLSDIGSVPLSDWDMVDGYLNIAHGLYRNRKCWLPKTKRIDVLTKSATLMQARFEELAFLIANEGG